MWPFGGKVRKTVSEQRVDNSAKIAAIAKQIHQLQARVVNIERNAPYEKNNNRRRNLDIEKLKIEKQIETLEKQHHQFTAANRG